MLSEKKSMSIGCEKGYPLELFKLEMKNIRYQFKCEGIMLKHGLLHPQNLKTVFFFHHTEGK